MSSFFPSPPAAYRSFTPRNLALARQLVAHPAFVPLRSLPDGTPNNYDDILRDLHVGQEEIDRLNAASLDLTTLVKPPDVDLIEEDGHWMAFGQVWPVRLH